MHKSRRELMLPTRSMPILQTLHLVSTHGTRYEVDMRHERQLLPLLREGRARIRLHAQDASRGDEFAHEIFDGISILGKRLSR